MSSSTNTPSHHTSTIGSIGAPSRRNTELALLVFAVVIPVFAYANVGLAIDGTVPSGLLGYGFGLGLLAGVGHLVVRKFARYADPLLLPLATLLNGLGLVIIWRLDQSPRLQQRAKSLFGAFSPDAPKQLLYSALGIAFFAVIIVFLKDHRILQRYTYISMVVSLVLLVAPVFFPAVNGAKIWISIGGFTIQPGEFAKIIIAIFFSGYLMVKERRARAGQPSFHGAVSAPRP